MGTSVSSAFMARIRTFVAAAAAFTLTLALLPATSFAEAGGTVAASFTGAESKGSGEAATPNSSSNEPQQVSASQDANDLRVAPMLASGLFGSSAGIISSDVTLDSVDPIIGSFTVDGLTYALNDGGVTLVSVVGPLAGPEGEGFAEGGFTNISIPSSVTYDGVTYDVTAVGPYAFYLSGATDVALPASVTSVDSRTFRSSDVARVQVDSDNPNLASFDGALYSADLTSLLLIPEGRAGAVLLPKQAEVVEASKFSHCSLVDAISMEEGGADFASWDGLLYDADGTTLIRVPAGATEITIRDGCTTIAAGALEGCAKLERIDAPPSVTSISSDAFESVPTVSLPAIALQDESVAASLAGAESASADNLVTSSQDDSVAGPLAGPGYEGDARSASADSPAEGEAEAQPSSQDETTSGVASSLLDQANASADSAPQLTAMVALSTADDGIPEVDPSSITVALPEGADATLWERFGFLAERGAAGAVATPSQAAVQKYASGITLCLQHNEILYGLWNGTDYANQVAQPLNNGWFFTGHGLNDEVGHICEVGWDAPRGVYLRRYGGVSAAFDMWPATRATSVSLTPTGPDLPAGTRLGDNAWVYFRTDNVIGWNPNGGSVNGSANPYYTFHPGGTTATSPKPLRPGYVFLGWYTEPTGGDRICGAGEQTDPIYAHDDYYAHWGQVVSFDTESEPDDADYPSDAMGDQTLAPDDGQVPIEDPKRPGYVFEGWVIPTEDGTEAIDQDLVYQGADKKWYVDASKLPDYAGDDGRVELTARWTAALSVDAPISATFMYDLSAWDGTEARDAYVEGSSTVKNRSAVPIRVSGIESAAGDAASVLKRGDGTTLADAPQGDAAKVLSVFPTTSAVTGTEGDAKAPASDDVADDLAHKVDMALSDVKLEAAFDHGAWAVDAATVGDNGVTVSTGDLKLGYRLNLGSATGVTLDQDALLAVTGDPDAGAAKDAAIANLTYCFAAEGLIPTGSKSDPLWVEVTDPEVGSVGVYGLSDIKRAADDFSSRVDPATDPNDQDAIYTQLAASPYFELFRQLFDKAVSFHLKVGNNYVDTQVIGFCQDSKSDGTGKAGLTFSYKNVAEQRAMNPTESNAGGWNSTSLRAHLVGNVWPTVGGTDEAGAAFRSDYVEPVMKVWQLYGGSIAGPSAQTLFIPSYFEAFGVQDSYYGIRESKANSFQYMYYAKGGGAANTGGSVYRVKTLDGQPAHWWLRSAVGSINGSFTHVGASSGSRNSSPANLVVYAGRKYGYTPCFAL